MRVLIVDDSMFMRRILGEVLVNLGHEIVGEAKNGKDAFDKYRVLKPDLVTMDITMPEYNGIWGVQKIVEYDKNALVIMCSAMGQMALVLESIQSGAKDFIVKPFESSRVAEAIANVQSK
jgi:two-component system, chemotaxis family, chemotaxis protein CheY